MNTMMRLRRMTCLGAVLALGGLLTGAANGAEQLQVDLTGWTPPSISTGRKTNPTMNPLVRTAAL